VMMAAEAIPGSASGIIIRSRTATGVAPSTKAASSSSLGMVMN
jgi:hypothetical protein